MKSLFKIILLATTMAVALYVPITFAAEVAKLVTTADNKAASRNDDQRSACALGASLGRYIENSPKEQKKLGTKLDEDQLIVGVQGVLADKSKLSDQETEQTLQAFEARVKSSARAKIEKDTTDNEAKGKKHCEKSTKGKSVRTSSTSLAYQTVEADKGETPRDSDTIVVNYKGMLIDDKELGNSRTRGEPLFFRLDDIIPGWTEGLRDIRKGGKIKLVILLELAYGKAGVPGIPPGFILVFDVELLNVKPASRVDARPEADAKATDSAKK